jgi:hypothetical protein
MTLHRDDPKVRPLYELSAGKRPERELFDLRKDAYQMRNVAGDPKYAGVVKRLDAQLMAELRSTGDPRVGRIRISSIRIRARSAGVMMRYSRSTISSPIASDAVAAGLGAFNTWIALGCARSGNPALISLGRDRLRADARAAGLRSSG